MVNLKKLFLLLPMLVCFPIINLGQNVTFKRIIGCMEKCSQHNGNVSQASVNIWFVASIPRAVTSKERRIASMHQLLASDRCSDATGHGGRIDKRTRTKHGSMTVYFTRGQTRYSHRLAAQNAQACTVTSYSYCLLYFSPVQSYVQVLSRSGRAPALNKDEVIVPVSDS